MKISFLNVPEWAHLGEYRCSGVVWQGQIGVYKDSTGTLNMSSNDATWGLYESRKFVKAIDSTGLITDSTGVTEYFILYKWPNEDEYESAEHAYGQKVLTNTPVVCVPLIPGFRIEDYDTQDNTSSLDSGVTWANVTLGAPMYINGDGRWTTSYVYGLTSLARAVFEKYDNGYVTFRIIEKSNFGTNYPV